PFVVSRTTTLSEMRPYPLVHSWRETVVLPTWLAPVITIPRPSGMARVVPLYVAIRPQRAESRKGGSGDTASDHERNSMVLGSSRPSMTREREQIRLRSPSLASKDVKKPR